MGTAFFRLKKLKGDGKILLAARHNRRAIQAEVGSAGHIDASHSCENETLYGPPTPEEVARLARNFMDAAGAKKRRKDQVMGLEILFCLPRDHLVDERSFFLDCVHWVGDRYGGAQNILSADIHRDEAAPHCHVLLLPLANGKLVGSDMVGGPQKLAAAHAAFYSAVSSRYGFRKAPKRLFGAAKASLATTVTRELQGNSDAVLRSAIWPAIRDAIESDPLPFGLALGLEIDLPHKRPRSSVEIFTSPGKGPRREVNAIGFEAVAREQSLSCVGFASATTSCAASSDPLGTVGIQQRPVSRKPVGVTRQAVAK